MMKFLNKLISRNKYSYTILSFITVVISLMIIYALLYMYLNYIEVDFYQENNNFEHFVDALYYSCMSMFTVGFGDFYPQSKIGKLITSSQVLLFWSIVLFFNHLK